MNARLGSTQKPLEGTVTKVMPKGWLEVTLNDGEGVVKKRPGDLTALEGDLTAIARLASKTKAGAGYAPRPGSGIRSSSPRPSPRSSPTENDSESESASESEAKTTRRSRRVRRAKDFGYDILSSDGGRGRKSPRGEFAPGFKPSTRQRVIPRGSCTIPNSFGKLEYDMFQTINWSPAVERGAANTSSAALLLLSMADPMLNSTQLPAGTVPMNLPPSSSNRTWPDSLGDIDHDLHLVLDPSEEPVPGPSPATQDRGTSPSIPSTGVFIAEVSPTPSKALAVEIVPFESNEISHKDAAEALVELCTAPKVVQERGYISAGEGWESCNRPNHFNLEGICEPHCEAPNANSGIVVLDTMDGGLLFSVDVGSNESELNLAPQQASMEPVAMNATQYSSPGFAPPLFASPTWMGLPLIPFQGTVSHFCPTTPQMFTPQRPGQNIFPAAGFFSPGAYGSVLPSPFPIPDPAAIKDFYSDGDGSGMSCATSTPRGVDLNGALEYFESQGQATPYSWRDYSGGTVAGGGRLSMSPFSPCSVTSPPSTPSIPKKPSLTKSFSKSKTMLYCEHCEKRHYGTYGSGRFCGQACRNRFNGDPNNNKARKALKSKSSGRSPTSQQRP